MAEQGFVLRFSANLSFGMLTGADVYQWYILVHVMHCTVSVENVNPG